MATKFIQHFPKPLLHDLVNGRWLPIVGSGMSRNAILPSDKNMPLWNELGKQLAEVLQDYEYVNAIDAISAYAYEFGRPKLIETLSDLLFTDDSQPGEVHRAFCSAPFDIVCTTNFDFLLERQYELGTISCTPITNESQLSVNLPNSTIALLKLHGDLNHPNQLVVTEEDYDKFLEKSPVFATYLSNLLITRTAVLIGYSLDDPDFRQIWQVVGERLGNMRRLAYVLSVGARPSDISRFERRGVKVINLPGSKARVGDILASTFVELRDHWHENIVAGSHVVEEEPLRELSLPADSATRLCYFSLPLSAQPFYRGRVFPIVREVGLVPLTADELVSPGGSLVARIDALLTRSHLVVIDASNQHALREARILSTRIGPKRLLIIIEQGAFIPIDVEFARVLYRPSLTTIDVQHFLSNLEEWFSEEAKEYEPRLVNEVQRLLSAREYRSAVISAITHLETTLRARLDYPMSRGQRFISIRNLLEAAADQQLLGGYEVKQITEWLKVRNDAVHSKKAVSARLAREIVSGCEDIRRMLTG